MPKQTPIRSESPTRRAVREMTAKGLSPRPIALTLGISTQAVYRHLSELRKAGELEERAS